MNDIELEVFKTGDYGPKGIWGEADLDGIAADYDPGLHEAPVTIDHAQRGPALGWVESLRRVGDRLVARLRGMNARMLELIREGAFKKRSVEIYPALKESGRPYLRAVSFLGAASPEVKGLADPVLMAEEAPLFEEEGAGHVALEMEERGEGMEIDGDRESENEKEKDKEKEREQKSFAFDALRGRLQQAGRWVPAWNERGIAEFFCALTTVNEINVNDNETMNAAEWFARFLEELPAVVMMGEAAPARKGVECLLMDGEFEPESVALHNRVVAFMEECPQLNYAEALRICAK